MQEVEQVYSNAALSFSRSRPEDNRRGLFSLIYLQLMVFLSLLLQVVVSGSASQDGRVFVLFFFAMWNCLGKCDFFFFIKDSTFN